MQVSVAVSSTVITAKAMPLLLFMAALIIVQIWPQYWHACWHWYASGSGHFYQISGFFYGKFSVLRY